jgi:hypothetical protein
VLIITTKNGIIKGRSDIDLSGLLPKGLKCVNVVSVWPLMGLSKPQHKARQDWYRGLPVYHHNPFKGPISRAA